MASLSGFLDAWDNPSHANNLISVDLCTTGFGNINSTGNIGDYQADALTKWHPQFYDAIEPKVRDLVHTIVGRFGWITYSSCQGHLYEGHFELPVERSIGLVPRIYCESQMISTILHRVTGGINQRFPKAPVFLELLVDRLESEDMARTVLNLCFRRRPPASWEHYFEYLELANAVLLEALINEPFPRFSTERP